MKIIFDTDPGIDDAMALLLLARHPDVELMAATSVFGNADIATATRNALYLRQRFGLAAPVARGAGGPLVGEPDAPPDFVHGQNGLGNIAIPDAAFAGLDPRPAHRLIIDLLKAQPGEITIVAVGRMTNLALALAEAPEITGLVRQVVVMGGAFGFNGHTGNVTPVAEANIWGDPHAADIVFGANWPVTIVGLDVTQQAIMTDAWLAELATTGDDGRFIREVSAFYQDFHRQSAGIEGFYVHDSGAVAYALHRGFSPPRRAAIRVVPDGIAVGQTIAAPEGRSYPDWEG